MPAIGTVAPKQLGLADHLRRADDPRQERALDAEQGEQLVVPRAAVEVEQHRPRGVRDVGDVLPPAGQAPDEPRVDRADCELAGRNGGALQQPLELRRREVRVRDEPGAAADQLGRQLAAPLGRAPVLPHDRVVDRPSGAPLPDERRLALVRDPDRDHVGGAERCGGERVRSRSEDALPELLRIVLHPAGLRVVLLDLAVPTSTDAQLVVHHETCRPGRALVDREDHACANKASIRARSSGVSRPRRPSVVRRRRTSSTVTAHSRSNA